MIEESVDYERADQQGNHAEDKNQVQLEVQVEDRNLEINCDPHLMRQVLLNLMRNSREAMPEGGRITIRGGRYDPGADDHMTEPSVCIEVEDTGEGIPEEIRDRIFRPFFSTKSSSNGTGLGLASAWKSIQAHGGVITLSSKSGRGSRFRIILPVNA